MLGIPFGIPEVLAAGGRLWTLMERKLLICICIMHKKRRPGTSLDVYLVEPGGFEPPSASPPLSVLHA